MQRDSSTYCDEPEDEEDYASWLETFDLEAKKPDIEALIAGNTFMAELQVGPVLGMRLRRCRALGCEVGQVVGMKGSTAWRLDP